MELCRWFGGLVRVDIMEEFNKLIQEDIVLQYQEIFKEILTENLELSEKYFISSFTSDLNDKVRPTEGYTGHTL